MGVRVCFQDLEIKAKRNDENRPVRHAGVPHRLRDLFADADADRLPIEEGKPIARLVPVADVLNQVDDGNAGSGGRMLVERTPVSAGDKRTRPALRCDASPQDAVRTPRAMGWKSSQQERGPNWIQASQFGARRGCG